MYYAEFNTDQFIREHFFPDESYKGVIVEVGAGPPVFISTSKHFRDIGWRAICVEPNPKFVQQHIDDGSEVYQYACADYEGKAKFTVNYNNDNWYTPESDGVSFSALAIRLNGVPAHNTQETIDVEITLLDNILQTAGVEKVDVLSIDTEGWELDVMRGFNHEKYSPKVIVLENINHDQSYDEYMKKCGYEKYTELKHNHIYIKKIKIKLGC